MRICVGFMHDHPLEQQTTQVVLPKAAMPFFGKGRVVEDRITEIEPIEPAIREVEMTTHARGS